MTTNKKDPVLVVLQMSGAYDALNTRHPLQRPALCRLPRRAAGGTGAGARPGRQCRLPPLHAPLKDLYDQGKVAVIQGIGYPNPIRSHFRSMDIWHTAEPEKMVTEAGWARPSATSTRSGRMC